MKILITVHIAILLLVPNLVNAQYADSFDDGNFDHNPTWSGTDSLFEIQDLDSLHLNAPGAGTAYLSTSSNAINNATWEMYAHLKFNPSGSNFFKFYLTSNTSNLNQTLNGYFVKVGGTQDEVSLYRQDGNKEIKIIDGLDDRVDFGVVKIKIKVLRDSTGHWELFSGLGPSYSFIGEGTVQDTTHLQSYYSGIYCSFTSTRSDKFYFDDFRVDGSIIVDKVAPKLTSLEIISQNEVLLRFSEQLLPETVEILDNYLLNPGSAIPSATSLLPDDSSSVIVLFASPFLNGNEYVLLVQNLRDLEGNQILATQYPFLYFTSLPSYPGDVIFSEVMADPSPSHGLPEAEYVEILNTSNQPINLKDWIYSDPKTFGSLDSVLLYPMEFLILCPSQFVDEFSSFGAVLAVSPWPSLNNSGDRITLQDSEGQMIDQLEFHQHQHSPEKFGGGFSLELVNWPDSCNPGQNWTSSDSQIGGSPGTISSLWGQILDTIAPVLVETAFADRYTLGLRFSEFIDQNSLDPSLFGFNNNSPSEVSSDSTGHWIYLHLKAPVDSGRINVLEIASIQD